MEISCPSCGAKHNTEDYPDAFEVQCACGYSLILPEVGTHLKEEEAHSGFSAGAAALEGEDEELQVSAHEVAVHDPLDSIPKVNEEMTPPDELPEEMPYDPFEIPSIDSEQESEIADEEGIDLASSASAEPVVDEFSAMEEEAQSAEFPSDDFGEAAPNQGEAGGEAEEADSSFSAESSEVSESADASAHAVQDEFSEFEEQEEPQEQEGQAPEEVDENLAALEDDEAEAQKSPSQKIVERAQLASMGQLIGFSYNLRWEGVEEGALKEVKHHCLPLVEERPWLQNELRKRGITLSKLESATELKNVPESLALEIFMKITELGGRVSYEQSSSS